MHLPASLSRPKPFTFARGIAACCALLLTIGSNGDAVAAPSQMGRFEQLREQDLRVANVAYKLATMNESRCKSVLAPQLGFVLHSIEQYGLTDREEAARSFGLGPDVGVMAVVGGSPAEKAGLRAGDQLLSVDGRDLSGNAVDGAPSHASVDRVRQALVDEMRRGSVTLRVSSSQGERELRFVAQLGCSSNVELIPGDEVNAWADGSRVMISGGLLRRCASDDDLALVIGHEMAHNLLHHRRRLAAEGVAVNGLLPLTDIGSAEVRATEEEADRFAVRLATTAAYDLSGAETFIGGLMSPRTAAVTTHPDLPRRLALLHDAIADAKQGIGPIAFRG
jgi:hypothetical protein